MNIESVEQLRDLYGFAKGRAKQKQLDKLDPHSINFIMHSPFVVVSSFDNKGGVDVSPKGGSPGFVDIVNNQQLLIPDVKGNNRLDGMINIIETGRVGTLFLIPGVDETLRINGTASITVEPALLEKHSQQNNPPKSAIKIQIEEVFLHCAKAFMRSKLWCAQAQIERSEFPTMGQMLNDQLKIDAIAESQESMVKRYQTDL